MIPDLRNDENLAVAQTHLAFIRFHNRVVDSLPASVPPAQRFAQARELGDQHYQWMMRTDFLPRICAHGVVNDVFNNGRKVFEVGATPTDVPTMPIEFSVAAFRLGHTMIRRAYNWNARFDNGAGTLDFLFTVLRHERRASAASCGCRATGSPTSAGSTTSARPVAPTSRCRRGSSTARCGSTRRSSNPLRNLPKGSFGGPSVPFDDPRANLAFRNLTRARMVKLATGQQMARFLRQRGVKRDPLTRTQIRDGNGGADLDALTETQRQAL